ncbi:hypothetical protein [Streptomyces sp. NPDC051016]|uniref:hypothetical protein n=1 Tax=Streptomyces sp. NPDC051016 TaxID=3365638 RepID=UPI0037BBA8C1
MTTLEIPTGPVAVRPDGFEETPVQAGVLRDTLAAAGVELGAYEHLIIDWLSHWEWATVAVIASWVARAATSQQPAPPVPLPGRFDATAAEVDQHLRRILAEDRYLLYQQAIGARSVAEAVDETRSTDLPDDYIDLFDNGVRWSGDLVDPAKGGGPYPSRLQCSQHGGFGPCPGAPECTPRETPTDAS